MGLMDKYNKGGVTFEIDIKDFDFKTLEELFKRDNGKTVFPVDGLYINKKSEYKDHPVVISIRDRILVDLPSFMTEDALNILQDQEVIDAIKAGKVGFQIETYYQKKYKKDCYGIKWRDIE